MYDSYVRAGLALVPIPRGKKGPRHTGWNLRENTITEPHQVKCINGGNVGLAHAYCFPTPTCAIDIDNLEKGSEWLAEHDIDLDALLSAQNAVQIKSGKPNRAKLLYQLPVGHAALTTVKSPEGWIEFRCASKNGTTLQDVLPPSIHPDTGQPYEWIGNFAAIPEIPPALRALWGSLLEHQDKRNTPQTRQTHRTKAHVDPQTLLPPAHINTRCGRQAESRAVDPIYQALAERGAIRGDRPDGGIDIVCPFEGEHTGPRNKADCTYFPAHTGGFSMAKIHCLHSHCGHRTLDEHKEVLGLSILDGSPCDGDARPAIAIKAGRAAEFCKKLASAFGAAGAPIYRRGEGAVRAFAVTQAEALDALGIRRARGAIILKPVTPASLLADAGRYAQILKYNARANQAVEHDLPNGHAQAFCALAGELDALPPLAGISEVPLMRADGSLFATAGYDPATCMLLKHGDWSALNVPERPTRDEATAALKVLLEPLIGFPFVDDASRSVALSAMMTAVLRSTMRAAPLHAFSAPAPGSGKSLLADVVAIIATGHVVSAMAMGKTDEEFEKKFDGLILAGDPVALIDNVSRPLSGDGACIMLTAAEVSVRRLGGSEITRCPSTTFWMATGNNLSAKGDMVRRVIRCDIDAGVERPEQRVFEGNLRDWTTANRMRLLSAIFTIRRAHLHADEPQPFGLSAVGSFEDWSRMVRGALLWLNSADPAFSMEALRGEDAEQQQRLDLFTAWHNVHGNAAVAVCDLLNDEDGLAVGPESEKRASLSRALHTLSTTGRPDRRRIGYWLRDNKDRIAGGFRLTGDGTTKGVIQWAVRPIG